MTCRTFKCKLQHDLKKAGRGHDDLGALHLWSVCVFQRSLKKELYWWMTKGKWMKVKITLNLTAMTKSLTSDVFSVFIFLATYLPRMPLKAEQHHLDIAVLVLRDLIAAYCSGKICLYFQIINLTETTWTDWFKPGRSQTPPHWETSSINGYNCFLWRVAGKTYSITFDRERSHTINCRLVHRHCPARYWLGQSAQSKQYLSH